MTEQVRKIVQIIPAEGWFAVYGDDDGKPTILVPLVCWALYEDEEGDRYIEGMDAFEYVDFSQGNHNFHDYRHKSEAPVSSVIDPPGTPK